MGHSIYLADDEKSIRELLHSFLASDGYTVRSFESGDALLEVAFDNVGTKRMMLKAASQFMTKES